MSHQIIPQPDGRLCVWSTVVDEIIIVDAEPDELVEYYADRASEDAREKSRRIIDLVSAGQARKVYYQFTMSYAEAVGADRAC